MKVWTLQYGGVDGIAEGLADTDGITEGLLDINDGLSDTDSIDGGEVEVLGARSTVSWSIARVSRYHLIVASVAAIITVATIVANLDTN